jgi:pimeloyl-ACP methyl ester carboxylesterase
VLEVGSASAEHTLLCMHGLRDSAQSLVPAFERNFPPSKYRILLPDLRGHGESQWSAAYGMANFILDLHNTVEQLVDGKFSLFGHSLGGHVAAKYAALYPENVDTLIIAEGLGPPVRPYEGDDTQELVAYRGMLERFRPTKTRTMVDFEEVQRRLQRNNPRLQPDVAQALVPHLVVPHENGWRWAFDFRANSAFIGASTDENKKFWRQVNSPTLLVSGIHSHEYWGHAMGADNFSGKFAEGEMENRIACFKDARHHWLEHSGHMIHYDEPQRLGKLCFEFMEQHV